MEYSRETWTEHNAMSIWSASNRQVTEATIEHGKNMGAAAGACLKDGGPATTSNIIYVQ